MTTTVATGEQLHRRSPWVTNGNDVANSQLPQANNRNDDPRVNDRDDDARPCADGCQIGLAA